MIDFKCPNCGEPMCVPSSLAGQTDKCPRCGNVVPVPSPSAARIRSTGAQRMEPAFALKKCYKCKARIPKEVAVCPLCKTKQPTTAGKIILAGIGAFLLVVVVLALSVGRGDRHKEDRGAPTGREAISPKPSMPGGSDAQLPKYKVLDRNVYDAPIKTQVQLDLLVSGELTPEGLRALMTKLYQKTASQERFRHHRHPTHVFIYAYSDKERAESGSGGWVARLERIGEGSQPKSYVNEKLLAALKLKPTVRFGLSEAKRREIYKELVRSEDRARKEAEAKYPLELHKALKVGQEVTLTKLTPLMPEFEPADAVSAIERIRRMQAGTVIRVLSVREKWFTPWYEVLARSANGSVLPRGWVNSLALTGQMPVDGGEQLKRQGKLLNNLKAQYDAEIGRKYGLTKGQLTAISVEAFEKHWPMPKLEE